MIVTKAKPRDVTADERRRAVAMVKAGATLREAAAAAGVSHQSVSNWVKAAELERVTFSSDPPRARKPKRRGPVYVDGVRLGRLALWS